MPSALIKYILSVFVIFSVFTQVSAQSENDYADFIQSLIGGQREYSVQSGRVDLLTDKYAFEIEWANKWKESIGQSLWYAVQTNKKPGIILLMKTKSDYKYFIQLNTALEYADLVDRVRVHIFPNDFEKLIEETKN